MSLEDAIDFGMFHVMCKPMLWFMHIFWVCRELGYRDYSPHCLGKIDHDAAYDKAVSINGSDEDSAAGR